MARLARPVLPAPFSMNLRAVPLLAQVSAAHLVSHLHIMAVPALLPLLHGWLGVGFVELGFALSVFNVVSAFVQAPMGFAVDRVGARRMLLAALVVGSLCFLGIGVWGSYTALVVGMAVAGIANGVYHPADYSLLSTGVDTGRVGRAFSIHTFAGYAGGAMAPATLMAVAAFAGVGSAFAVTAVVGFAAALFLLLPSQTSAAQRSAEAVKPAATKPAPAAPARVFTPAVFGLTFLFTLLSLSTGAIQNFSVSALVSGHGFALSLANTGLTAFLFASAFGVLAGGALADRTRHHGLVAAGAFGITAVLVALVALFPLPGFVFLPVITVAGFLSGVIAPSRDMLVRAAAPRGAEGRVFGIVSTGFNIGGATGPLIFGWLLDQNMPLAVFWAAVGFMLLTVVVTLAQDMRATRTPAAEPAPRGS